MISNRPYLLRALHEWILDNGMTPYVVVDAEAPGVQVPGDYVQDGKIVLNISPSALRDLLINNESLSFHARFGGKARQVYAPVSAVLAIYAKEAGNGMVFPEEEHEDNSTREPTSPPAHARKKPHLKVVK